MARHYSENAALADHAKNLVSNLNLTGKRSLGDGDSDVKASTHAE
jgi:hypothetical protein